MPTFCCSFCGEHFESQSSLAEHKRMHHPAPSEHLSERPIPSQAEGDEETIDADLKWQEERERTR